MAERPQTEQLYQSLAEARETYRLNKAKTRGELTALERERKDAQKLHLAAEAERMKLKKFSKKFLARLKAKWSAERIAVETARKAMVRERAEMDRREVESREYQERLYASWEQLQDAQRRLLADRHQAELWIGQQLDIVDHRTATAKEHERQQQVAQTEFEQKIAGLKAEIDGLETRAANARAAVEKLEREKSRLVSPIDAFDPISTSLVPIEATPKGGDPNAILADLHTRQQDLDRVRRKIFAARDELEQQSTSLESQRAILAEQVAALATARELWNSAEVNTLAELEELARNLRHKEQSLELRERELIAAAKMNDDREGDIAAAREELESWRGQLAEHERTAKDAHFEFKAKESQLDDVLRTWADLREKERLRLAELAGFWTSEFGRRGANTEETDRVREQYLTEVAKLASSQLAMDEALAEKGLAASRRFRVRKAHWEKHFQHWHKELEQRKTAGEAWECRALELTESLRAQAESWLSSNLLL